MDEQTRPADTNNPSGINSQPGNTNTAGTGFGTEPSPAGPTMQQPGAPLNSQVVPPATVKKSKAPLFIGIAVACLLAIIGFIVLTALPGLQANGASRTFMNAAAAGDTNTLNKLNESSTEEDKSFMKDVADNLKGNFQQKDSTLKDSKYYYLYTLSGAKSKFARTIVEKKDGKYRVTNIVYSQNELALVPGAGASTDTKTTPQPQSAPSVASTPAGNCVAQADTSSQSLGFSDSKNLSGYKVYDHQTFFFEPDSTKDSYPSQTADITAKYSRFAKNFASKDFKITISGKARDVTPTASGYKLSVARAKLIYDQLLAQGTPAAKIDLQAPRPSGADSDTGADRNVYMELISTGTCSG